MLTGLRLTYVRLAVAVLLSSLVATSGAARPPQNHSEIEKYCERAPDGSLLLNQCDVPEKSTTLYVLEWLLLVSAVGGLCWLWGEAHRRRTNYPHK